MTTLLTVKPAQARRPRRTRTDRLTTAWMLVALLVAVAAAFQPTWFPHSWWTLIHLVTLGVLTNGILQWSWYFSRSLLRLPPQSRHSGKDQTTRQILFNILFVELIVGMWLSNGPLVIAGAVAIALVLTWHGLALLWVMRTRLGSRFSVIVRYYAVAAAFLVAGATLAAVIAAAMFAPAPEQTLTTLRPNLTLAHSLVNFLGWIGLSIAGTIVTLGPTILRTRMEEGAVSRAVATLPFFAVAVTGMGIAVSLGSMALAGVFMLVYVAAAAWGIAEPLTVTFLRSPKWTYAPLNMLAGFSAGFFALMWWTLIFFTAPTANEVRDVQPQLVGILGAASVLPIFIGALTYLLPVVLGGGPAAVKVGIRQAETGAAFRFTLRIAALVLAVASTGSAISRLWWLVVALSYLLDLLVFISVGITQKRTKSSVEQKPKSVVEQKKGGVRD